MKLVKNSNYLAEIIVTKKFKENFERRREEFRQDNLKFIDLEQ
jgi:hypothetical protein